MIAAFGWGLLTSSSLILGGLLALWRPLKAVTLGLVMAFGSGVLLSAVAYDLVGESFDRDSGGLALALGLMMGALTFFVGDHLIDARGGEHRKRSKVLQASGSGRAIVLGILLDGIPESIVIGLSLLGGTGPSVAVVVAVFLSNFPEAVAATTGLEASGWTRRHLLALWGGACLMSGVFCLLGYRLFGRAEGRHVAFMQAFAAGAILTMLADTMMPEAFEHGGKRVGLATTLGFGLAFALSVLGGSGPP